MYCSSSVWMSMSVSSARPAAAVEHLEKTVPDAAPVPQNEETQNRHDHDVDQIPRGGEHSQAEPRNHGDDFVVMLRAAGLQSRQSSGFERSYGLRPGAGRLMNALEEGGSCVARFVACSATTDPMNTPKHDQIPITSR